MRINLTGEMLDCDVIRRIRTAPDGRKQDFYRIEGHVKSPDFGVCGFSAFSDSKITVEDFLRLFEDGRVIVNKYEAANGGSLQLVMGV